MTIKAKVTWFSLLLLVAGSSVLARVAGSSLDRLVAKCDLVVIAKVERIHNIPLADGKRVHFRRVAQCRVERVLKGETTAQTVFYLASPTWTCDMSGGTENERALLCLSKEPNGFFKSTELFESKFKAIADGQPLHGLALHGGGRLQLITLSGQEYVRGNHYVRFPDGFSIRPDPNDPTNKYESLAPLSEALSLIEAATE